VQTVRLYADQGLLGSVTRSVGGYRQFDPRVLPRIRLIRRLRGFGCPLGDLSRLLPADLGRPVSASRIRAFLGGLEAEHVRRMAMSRCALAFTRGIRALLSGRRGTLTEDAILSRLEAESAHL